MRSATLLLALLLANCIYAQWDIRVPGEQGDARCNDCLRNMDNKPKEVLFGFVVDPRNEIWFAINDMRFFDALFKRSTDGIAVDVVPRDRYACGRTVPEHEGLNKGTLLEPVYLPALKSNMEQDELGVTYLKVGKLPAQFVNKPVELNLVILQDRTACYYNNFYDLRSYRWDLLNMGLFMDSLRYQDAIDTTRSPIAASVLRRKALHFTIPFERGRTTYQARDLQPLYDSLRLTNFTIKHIDIRAYSSVDGPEATNIALQEERAKAIVAALQSFQSPTIRTTVSASENWVEFLNDISGTKYEYLGRQSKEQVKAALRDRSLLNALEPLLARHRKAVVTLELQRRTEFSDASSNELVERFERSLAEQNMEQAMRIQHEVFQRVLDHDLPTAFLERLDVPNKKEYALLLNSRAAYRHFLDPADVFATYLALQELDRLAPGNGRIKYNLCALKFRVWLLGAQAVDPVAFGKEIDRLRSYGIAENLVTRMHINRSIILAEQHMRAGDYARKDEALKYIHRNYRQVDLSDSDLLSLAQYFTSFGNHAWALEVIAPKLSRIDVDRDLLFYYLNLTLVEPELTADAQYRKVLLNAINLDRRRFCNLFRPYGKGGITFQLLDNPYLHTVYCENCTGTYGM